MVMKIIHIFQTYRNIALAILTVILFNLLFLAIIGLTIRLKIVLYIIGFGVIFLFSYVIGQRYFNKSAFIFSVVLTSAIILSLDFDLAFLNQVLVLIWCLLPLIIIEYVMYSWISVIGQEYIDKIIKNKKLEKCDPEDNEYSVVLIGNNLSWFKNNDTHVGACGLYFLIKYFKNTNKHYVICQKVEKSHFDKFILDDKCQELYIIGHGSKNSFRINIKTDEDDGNIYYSEYKDAPEKRVIAQLHCAHNAIDKKNDSLVDLLVTDKGKSYVGSGYIYFFNEWWYYLNTWINNE